MIGAIQRLLQLIVIAGVVFAITRPAILPEPARGIATSVHLFVIGPEDNWTSFQTTWKQRLDYVGTVIPWVKSIATTIPDEPPQITADGILNFFGKIVITRPMEKFETIKQEVASPPAATSGASQ